MKKRMVMIITFIVAVALISVSSGLSGMPFTRDTIQTGEESSQLTTDTASDQSGKSESTGDGSTAANSESTSTTATDTTAGTTTGLPSSETTPETTSDESVTDDSESTRQTTDEKTTQSTNGTTTKATTSSATTTTATTSATDTTTTTSATGVVEAFYVSTTGNNANQGSAASPFRTIQHAIETVPSGSTILVTEGEYRERLVIRNRTRLEIKNKSGERPVLSGADFSDGYLVEIAASQHILFSGFEVRDFTGPDLECVIIRNSSSHISISNCVFHDIGTPDSNGNAHVILALGKGNSPLTNINVTRNEIYRCTTGWSEVITMESNVDGFAITHNTIHDVTNIAIDATGFYDNDVTNASMNQARNGLIANNLIYNVTSPNATCAGIYVDGGRDIVIEDNTVHNSMYGIEIGCENPVDETNPSIRAVVSNITVHNNIVYDNSKIGIMIGGYDGLQTGQVVDSRIENNTLYNNRNELELAYCSRIAVRRNIFYGVGDHYLVYNDSVNPVIGLRFSDNIYFTDTNSGKFKLKDSYADNLVEWQSISGQDLDSRFIDPLFINPERNDFRLQPGSPAAGVGAR